MPSRTAPSIDDEPDDPAHIGTVVASSYLNHPRGFGGGVKDARSTETRQEAQSANEHSVFISFRFAEAEAEANALKHELEARGHKTFVSNETPGSDLQTAIADAIGQSKIQVLLATQTYGRKTNQQYSTFQEMNYALNHAPFLVKMPADVVWEEAATEMALCGRMWAPWQPGEPVPDGLVDQIIAKLEASD